MSLRTHGEEAVVLRTFPTHDNSDAISHTSRNGQGSEPSRNIEPSRNYQYLLVLAGFMMTFHVIGINSVYGLFQVSACCTVNNRVQHSAGILYLSRDEHQRCGGARRPSFPRRNHRKWPYLERQHFCEPSHWPLRQCEVHFHCRCIHYEHRYHLGEFLLSGMPPCCIPNSSESLTNPAMVSCGICSSPRVCSMGSDRACTIFRSCPSRPRTSTGIEGRQWASS